MRIKINWTNTITALLITTGFVLFPFLNPCELEDSKVCTWNATEQGNGSGTSFTDFYGITLYSFGGIN